MQWRDTCQNKYFEPKEIVIPVARTDDGIQL